jgi:DNA-directed RNA polymerase specialized sigma24 family protein
MSALPNTDTPPAPELRRQLDGLLSNRHSPEARALFVTLAGYVDRRLQTLVRTRYADLLSGPEREEVVSEVLYELLNGALAGFRGESMPELLGYVRRICDRHCWKAAQKRIRERDALEGQVGEVVRAWFSQPAAPDSGVEVVPPCPLDEKDADYLVALVSSGSRAELARVQGVSRAAVTQRVQRIKRRIGQLSPREVEDAEVWLRHQTLRVVGSVG